MEKICLLKVIGTSVLCFFCVSRTEMSTEQRHHCRAISGFSSVNFSFFHITPFKAEIGLYISHISNK